jgi:L-aminopeptidase/D-esterase-like protein
VTLPGPTNSLLDIAGLAVGHAGDARLRSGVTVVLPDRPAVAAVHVMGGAPGTRETDLLAPEETVAAVDALVLAGGSAFGLDAASGVQAWLRAAGRGFAVGPVRVPIVPAAILFDLLNGGDKDWGRYPPYRDLGWTAAEAAGGPAGRTPFALGATGAGLGATTADGPGGLGTASAVLASGVRVAALVAVNAVGAARAPDGRYWAAPFEIGDEFGGLGLPAPLGAAMLRPRLKGLDRGANTTIAVIATDAVLTKPEAKRLAVQAHDGFARALWPAHTDLDGDLVFALATGAVALGDDPAARLDLAAAATAVMARAIARGVSAGRSAAGLD